MDDYSTSIPVKKIEKSIFLIRGNKVLMDSDLADLYDVETKYLIQAVKRNIERFPPDFMFQLTQDEFSSLRSQIVTSKGKGGRRYLPYAFTEQGVAMLSSVLRSKRAIQVNIAIMRVFVRLRELMLSHRELAHRLAELEHHVKYHDKQIQSIFDAIHRLVSVPIKPKKKIGFEVKETQANYGKKGKKSQKKA
jgi:hypothetical protein